MAKTTGDSPWKRKRPADAKKTTLAPSYRAQARQRARAAGRKYPNLVDNMWAAGQQRSAAAKARKKSSAKKGGAKKGGAKKGGAKKGGAKKGGAKKGGAKKGARKKVARKRA